MFMEWLFRRNAKTTGIFQTHFWILEQVRPIAWTVSLFFSSFRIFQWATPRFVLLCEIECADILHSAAVTASILSASLSVARLLSSFRVSSSSCLRCFSNDSSYIYQLNEQIETGCGDLGSNKTNYESLFQCPIDVRLPGVFASPSSWWPCGHCMSVMKTWVSAWTSMYEDCYQKESWQAETLVCENINWPTSFKKFYGSVLLG